MSTTKTGQKPKSGLGGICLYTSTDEAEKLVKELFLAIDERFIIPCPDSQLRQNIAALGATGEFRLYTDTGVIFDLNS